MSAYFDSKYEVTRSLLNNSALSFLLKLIRRLKDSVFVCVRERARARDVSEQAEIWLFLQHGY